MHLVDAKKAKNVIDDFKNSSTVWTAWSVQSGFDTFAKKNFTAEVLECQLARTSEMEELIVRLEKQVDKLVGMHQASMQ